MSLELRVPRVARAMVGFTRRRPLVMIALGLALMFSLTPGMKRLKADFTYRGFFYDEDPLLVQFNEPSSMWSTLFGTDGATIIEAYRAYNYEKIHTYLISRWNGDWITMAPVRSSFSIHVVSWCTLSYISSRP